MLLSVSVQVLANDTLIYNQTVTVDTIFSHYDNVEIVAHNTITLDAGFTFSSNGNGSFIANADPWNIEEPPHTVPPGNTLDSIGTLDGSFIVGTINGQPGVSPTGAATYSIPIEVPSGNKGMVPQLAITYNSQAGNGLLGRGWSLSGLSSIVAVGKTKYYDNESSIISDTNSECRVAWDGQRLIALNSAGLDADSFRTEHVSNIKITREQIYYDLFWFKVTTPDGRTMEYGFTANSRLSLDASTEWKWMLNKVSDRNGNSIEYTYEIDEDTGEILLSEIKYGGKAPSFPVNTISFHYTTRDDISYGYIHNDLIVNDQLLKDITIESYNESFGKYEFFYDTTKSETLLDEIVQYDKDNYRFNATKINWEFPVPNMEQTPSTTYINSGPDYLDFSGDFTGDGYTDLVTVNTDNWVYYLYKGSTVGIKTVHDFSDILPRSYVYEGWSELRQMCIVHCNGSSIPDTYNFNDIENVSAGDFDGDGIMELMVEVLEWSPLIPHLSDNYNIFNGIDYVNANCGGDSNKYSYPDSIVLDYNVCRFINFDIDASTYFQRVRTLKYGPDNLGLKLEMDYSPDILKLGYSPFCIDKKVQYIDDNYEKRTHVLGTEVDPEWMELNGDGFYDYIQDSSTFFHIMLYQPEADSFAYENTINSGYLGSIDLNGDGISGYVSLGNEEFDSITVSVSSLWGEYCTSIGGCTFPDIITEWEDFLEAYGLEYEYETYLSVSCNDVDDLDCWSSFRSETSVTYPDESLGRELFIDHLASRGPRVSLGHYDGHDSIFSKAIASDIDANGRNELLIFSKDTLKMIFYDFKPSITGTTISYNYDSVNCNFKLGEDVKEGDFNGDGIVELVDPKNDKKICFVDSGKPGHFVTSITNGLGIETRYSYKPLTNSSVYKKENTAIFPVIDFIAPWYVLSSISSDNGVADSSFIEYNYQGAKIHLEGKGFLGFAKRKVENDLSDISKVSWLDYDTTFFHSYSVSDTISSVAGYLQFTDTHTSIDSIDVHKYLVKTDSVTIQNVQAGTTTTNSFDYNNDGFISEKGMNVNGEATITEKYDYISAGWYVNALPQYVSKTYTRNGNSETDSIYYSYESTKGNFIQKKDFYKSDREIVTSYSDFDSYGNPKTIETSGKRGANLSVTSIETDLTYSSDGRFLLSKEGPLDYKTTYEYDSSTGMLESQTTPNRTNTTLEYGPFGAMKKITGPNLIEKSSRLFWAHDHPSSPDSALFYNWTAVSGTSPALKFFDERGRELRSVAMGFNNDSIYVDTKYDTKGRVSQKSMPYYSTNSPLWTTITYDNFGRMLTVTSPDTAVSTYNYSLLRTTVTTIKGSDTIETSKLVNAMGETTQSEDNIDNVVHYSYYPDGKLKFSYVSTHTSDTTSFSYDAQGNRTSISDPDAGTITSMYDAFGQLLRQINAKNDTTTYQYDVAGRTTKLTDARGDIFYSYVTDTTTAAFGQLDSVYNSDHSLQEVYTYDSDYGMLLTHTRTGVNKTFTNTFTYDWFGRPMTRTYPSDFELEYAYTSNGDLDQVRGNGLTLWSCNDANSLGQITSYSQGGNSTSLTYNMHGELNRVYTAGVMDMCYTFDDMGNLSSRKDDRSDQMEVFEYDNLNRLIGIDYYDPNGYVSTADLNIGYDNCGNIISKTDVSSTINYGEGEKPHALTSIENPNKSYDPPPQNISYNVFNKMSLISDTLSGGGLLELDIKYGLGNQRIKTTQARDSIVERVKYFNGDYEEDSTSAGIKKYHYIYGGTGLTAIFVMEGSGNDTLHYVLSDHLGSLTAIVNASTSEVKNYSFNAWGMPRNASDWTISDTSYLFAGRGFTGHEHLSDFNLINMNGRIYDPLLGRFLSPDPIVQAPGNPNSYNRYSYVLNNPLKYVDPSGYLGDPTTLTKYSPFSEADAYGDNSRFSQAPNMISSYGGGSGFGNNWFDIQTDPTGGWWKAPTGEMVNRYSGKRMNTGEFRSRYLDPSSSISESDKQFVGFGTRYNEDLDIVESHFGWEITEIPMSSNGYKDVTAEFDEQLSNTMIYFSLAKHRFDREFPKDRLRKLLFFRSKVNDHAVFDIKRTSFSRANLGSEYGFYRGQSFRYDDFGNYNFGLAARSFGLSLKDALRGAGLNQIRKLDPDLNNSLGYFDHTRDTQLIIMGFFHEY